METSNITKEQLIDLHREMWKWIANEISKARDKLNIINLKEEFIDEYSSKCKREGKPCVYPVSECFACEYACDRTIELHPNDYSEHCKCEYCPFEWFSSGDEEGHYMCECNNNFDDKTGLYAQCKNMRGSNKYSWKKQAKLAYKIAMLPAREE